MNSFKIREYVEVDENDVDWTKVDQKIKRGARSWFHFSEFLTSFLEIQLQFHFFSDCRVR